MLYKVIVNSGNKTAKAIWETNRSKALPRNLWVKAKAIMVIMHSTQTLTDLQIQTRPSHLYLHKLKGGRKDDWGVTIKRKQPWRITFNFKDSKFTNVKIENYHRG